MKFKKIAPILRIFDESLAKQFYSNYLGFEINWEHRYEDGLPIYMQVSRDDCVLHLSEHHGDCCPGAAMRIEINDIENYYFELSKKEYRYLRPSIEKMPWGSKDLSIKDPFGNRLTFTDAIYT